MTRRPLEGLRVLDLGTRVAAPFCAGLLGEQGAEVIKVEKPGQGDPLRDLGPFVDCLLYTSPSPRDGLLARMPSSA